MAELRLSGSQDLTPPCYPLNLDPVHNQWPTMELWKQSMGYYIASLQFHLSEVYIRWSPLSPSIRR